MIPTKSAQDGFQNHAGNTPMKVRHHKQTFHPR